MKQLALASLALLVCTGAHRAEFSVTIYNSDPQHLWNRLYDSIAVRTENGVRYGIDGSVPFIEPFDDSKLVATVANEFVTTNGERRVTGPLPRALLLQDIWTAFDLAAFRGDESTARSLANVIAKLVLSQDSIAQLPDNYADAVGSGNFARDLDPRRPEQAFLPADLFDIRGSWVQLGGSELIAPVHTRVMSGRSVFLLFIRCPGGRNATLAYLSTLNQYPNPWLIPSYSSVAHSASAPQAMRANSLRLNPATPQFPDGTIFALVRQMAVIDEKRQPVPTRITQSVQFRVYTKVAVPGAMDARNAFSASQHTFEFVMRRKRLLNGQSGGLEPLDDNDAERDTFNSAPIEGTRSQQLQGPVIMTTCVRCHGGAPGILSVQSYSRSLATSGHRTLSPALVPADSDDSQSQLAMNFKRAQFDWGLLRGMLPGD